VGFRLGRGSGDAYSIVGASADVPVTPGVRVDQPTRVPAKAGDLLGLFVVASEDSGGCAFATQSGEIFILSAGNVTSGPAPVGLTVNGGRLSVAANVEPDADADGVAVDAYEHPVAVRDRTQSLIPADVFPHATTLSRTRDLDHVIAYDDAGPPGQTGDLTAKTHLGYQVSQVSRTAFVWRTPHGLLRHVDHTGTHAIDRDAAWRLDHPDWLDEAIASLRRQDLHRRH
jgi:hypothetical protein